MKLTFLQKIKIYTRYIFFAILSILGTFLTWILSFIWILPLMTLFTKDGNLPKCLRWFQTHDNPSDALWYGNEGASHRINDYEDYKWLFKHTNEEISKSIWLKLRARRAWFIRNPFYGGAYAFGMNGDNVQIIFEEIKGIPDSQTDWSRFRIYKNSKGQYFFNYFAYQYHGTSLAYTRYNIGYKHVGDSSVPNYMITTHWNPFRGFKYKFKK